MEEDTSYKKTVGIAKNLLSRAKDNGVSAIGVIDALEHRLDLEMSDKEDPQ